MFLVNGIKDLGDIPLRWLIRRHGLTTIQHYLFAHLLGSVYVFSFWGLTTQPRWEERIIVSMALLSVAFSYPIVDYLQHLTLAYPLRIDLAPTLLTCILGFGQTASVSALIYYLLGSGVRYDMIATLVGAVAMILGIWFFMRMGFIYHLFSARRGSY